MLGPGTATSVQVQKCYRHALQNTCDIFASGTHAPLRARAFWTGPFNLFHMVTSYQLNLGPSEPWAQVKCVCSHPIHLAMVKAILIKLCPCSNNSTDVHVLFNKESFVLPLIYRGSATPSFVSPCGVNTRPIIPLVVLLFNSRTAAPIYGTPSKYFIFMGHSTRTT